ncbi:hypothetical protein R1sor_002112 [Riccia sorocarpa]|uniref:Uncharacterized protein n=1 Tax=Riccia sorocarpa TaxID=122646 RepID=A0ABD3GXV2_9MARC
MERLMDGHQTHRHSEAAPELCLRSDVWNLGFIRWDTPFDSTEILFVYGCEDDKDTSVKIIFFHAEGMAAVFGVGLSYASVHLEENSSAVTIKEITESTWREFWMPSKKPFGSAFLFRSGNFSPVRSVPVGPLDQLSIVEAANRYGVGVEVMTFDPTPACSWPNKIVDGAWIRSLDSRISSFGPPGMQQHTHERQHPDGTNVEMAQPKQPSSDAHSYSTLETCSEKMSGTSLDTEGRKLTVIIHLNDKERTFFQFPKDIYTENREPVKIPDPEILESYMHPVLTITFSCAVNRMGIVYGSKAMTSKLAVDYCIKEPSLGTNCLGCYQSSLRMSFEYKDRIHYLVRRNFRMLSVTPYRDLEDQYLKGTFFRVAEFPGPDSVYFAADICLDTFEISTILKENAYPVEAASLMKPVHLLHSGDWSVIDRKTATVGDPTWEKTEDSRVRDESSGTGA